MFLHGLGQLRRDRRSDEGRGQGDSVVQDPEDPEPGGRHRYEIYVNEGQIVDAGAPLIRLDDTRFASNVGETEADRLAMLLRVERLSAEVDDRPLNFSAEDVLKAGAGSGHKRRVPVQEPSPATDDEIGGLQEQLIQRQQELREFTSKQAQYRQQPGLAASGNQHVRAAGGAGRGFAG